MNTYMVRLDKPTKEERNSCTSRVFNRHPLSSAASANPAASEPPQRRAEGGAGVEDLGEGGRAVLSEMPENGAITV